MKRKTIIYISFLLSLSIAFFILLPVNLNIKMTGQVSLDACKKNIQLNHISGIVYIPITSTVVLNAPQYRIIKWNNHLSFISPPIIEINKPPV